MPRRTQRSYVRNKEESAWLIEILFVAKTSNIHADLRVNIGPQNVQYIAQAGHLDEAVELVEYLE